MKPQIKQLTILLFSFVLFACNNGQREANNSSSNSQLLEGSEADTTIVIATLDSGETSFVVNQNVLKSDWQEFLSNIPEYATCTLNSVEIVSNVDSTVYYLVASGTISGENMKSTIELKLEQPSCLYITGLTVTCTTTACSSEGTGCIPVILHCTECGNKGKCTKSVSNSPRAIFSSIEASTCQN